MKSTGDFGFLPGNNARANTTALQKAVDKTGTIRIEQPGIYDIDDTVYISSDTALVFGKGVYIRRTTDRGYVFINKGAYTREYDYNISITGLNLLCNGHNSKEGNLIVGLRGQVCFFYVKDLVIRDLLCLDLTEHSFCIHICTFENLLIENVHIEGLKDGIHIDKGSKFTIRHGVFKTFDDPIALNAHDYTSCAPELGWIEDGIIEDCYDLDQEKTTGYFCRLLAGSWLDWFKGMKVQQSDTVVYNNKIYRVNMQPDGKIYTSNTAPNHSEGTKEYDGIRWTMLQDREIVYNCGCRNIHFRNIFLKKKRHMAFALTFDKNEYSRGYYPNSIPPVQEDITFERIYVQNEIIDLLGIRTPVNTIKLTDSVIGNNRIYLRYLEEEGITYIPAHVLISNTTFKGDGKRSLVYAEKGRKATLKIKGSIKENASYEPLIEGDIEILKKDI